MVSRQRDCFRWIQSSQRRPCLEHAAKRARHVGIRTALEDLPIAVHQGLVERHDRPEGSAAPLPEAPRRATGIDAPVDNQRPGAPLIGLALEHSDPEYQIRREYTVDRLFRSAGTAER